MMDPRCENVVPVDACTGKAGVVGVRWCGDWTPSDSAGAVLSLEASCDASVPSSRPRTRDASRDASVLPPTRAVTERLIRRMQKSSLGTTVTGKISLVLLWLLTPQNLRRNLGIGRCSLLNAVILLRLTRVNVNYDRSGSG